MFDTARSAGTPPLQSRGAGEGVDGAPLLRPSSAAQVWTHRRARSADRGGTGVLRGALPVFYSRALKAAYQMTSLGFVFCL